MGKHLCSFADIVFESCFQQDKKFFKRCKILRPYFLKNRIKVSAKKGEFFSCCGKRGRFFASREGSEKKERKKKLLFFGKIQKNIEIVCKKFFTKTWNLSIMFPKNLKRRASIF